MIDSPLERGGVPLTGRRGVYIRNRIITYNSKLKELARDLRKQGIYSEVVLWKELKGKKMGFDFHRQKPIDDYIVDFYCSELMLAIEVDGNSHNDKSEYDKKRQRRLESLGISVLRFKDFEVTKNVSAVIENIRGWIKEHTPSR